MKEKYVYKYLSWLCGAMSGFFVSKNEALMAAFFAYLAGMLLGVAGMK